MEMGNGLLTNMAAQYETTLGATPILRIYQGTKPVDCQAPIGGATQLFTLTLPTDWMTPTTPGTVVKNGTWAGPIGADGTGQFYRLWKVGATVCEEQGTVTATGGGGDLEVDNLAFVTGQTCTITAWTRTQQPAP